MLPYRGGNSILVLSFTIKVSKYIFECEISCRLLPTCFSTMLLQNCIAVKKGNISRSVLEKITCINRKLANFKRFQVINPSNFEINANIAQNSRH